ncbi:hypothetical protein FRC17_006788 [Serendipita sp. 399]|nr:hypothetical protein FRC17_006788 [Serendipita sp. 399]
MLVKPVLVSLLFSLLAVVQGQASNLVVCPYYQPPVDGVIYVCPPKCTSAPPVTLTTTTTITTTRIISHPCGPTGKPITIIEPPVYKRIAAPTA